MNRIPNQTVPSSNIALDKYNGLSWQTPGQNGGAIDSVRRGQHGIEDDAYAVLQNRQAISSTEGIAPEPAAETTIAFLTRINGFNPSLPSKPSSLFSRKEIGFSTTIDRYCELAFLPEDEEYTPPTQRAYASSLKLIIQVRDLLRDLFPPALVTTTEHGGINWYWRKPGFSVQLTIAGTQQGKDYIYLRDRSKSMIQDEVTASRLAAWLLEYGRR